MTIVVGEKPKGLLLGSTQAAPGSVDLSDEGTLDWVHWGLTDKNSVNRKADANLIDGNPHQGGQRVLRPHGRLSCRHQLDRRFAHGRRSKDTHTGLWWNNHRHVRRALPPGGHHRAGSESVCFGNQGRRWHSHRQAIGRFGSGVRQQSWNGNAALTGRRFLRLFGGLHHPLPCGIGRPETAVEWRLSSEAESVPRSGPLAGGKSCPGEVAWKKNRPCAARSVHLSMALAVSAGIAGVAVMPLVY